MKLLKVLSALIILLTSGYSFSFSAEAYDADNISSGYHVTENLQEGSASTYDSILPVHNYFSKIFLPVHYQNFSFCSAHRETVAKEYFSISKLIHPGLGIAKIIFPFHSFL